MGVPKPRNFLVSFRDPDFYFDKYLLFKVQLFLFANITIAYALPFLDWPIHSR